jgi:hypothetical protein
MQLDKLEIRSLSHLHSRLTATKEDVLAQEIARERAKAQTEATSLQHLHLYASETRRSRPASHHTSTHTTFAISPREHEEQRFLNVLARNAAPARSAGRSASVPRKYAEVPEEENRDSPTGTPARTADEARVSPPTASESPPTAQDAEPQEVQAEAVTVEAHTVAQEDDKSAGMQWPPATKPSHVLVIPGNAIAEPVSPGGNAEVAWPVAKPREGWEDHQDIRWSSPPVVVAEPVVPDDKGGATGESKRGEAAAEAQPPPEEHAGTDNVNYYRWPAPGFVDPAYKDPLARTLSRDLEWPGEKGKEGNNGKAEVPWPESVRGKTPPLPEQAPSDTTQPDWFHKFESSVSAVVSPNTATPPSQPPPPPPLPPLAVSRSEQDHLSVSHSGEDHFSVGHKLWKVLFSDTI